MQLERVVSLRRRNIGFVKLNRRAGERSFGISAFALLSWDRTVGGEHHLWIVAGFKPSLYVRLFFGVGRAHCISCGFGRFECLSHRQRDVLAVVTDHVVFEWWATLFANAIEARCLR